MAGALDNRCDIRGFVLSYRRCDEEANYAGNDVSLSERCSPLLFLGSHRMATYLNILHRVTMRQNIDTQHYPMNCHMPKSLINNEIMVHDAYMSIYTIKYCINYGYLI